MDGEASLLVGLLLLFLLLAAFVAAAEVALASVSRLRVRQMTEAGVSQARVAQMLLSDPARFLSTLMTLKALAFVGTAGTISLIAWRNKTGWPGMILAWLGTVLLLLITQIAPRARSLRNPETFALYLSGPVQFFATILTPVTAPLRYLGGRLRGHNADAKEPEESLFLSEDGLRFLLNVAEEESIIEEEEREMIGSILELGDTLVREVMVPRPDIAAVEVDTPLHEAVDVVLNAGHSRIPVYKERIDNIVGILYAKDLLRALHDGPTDRSLSTLLRPAYFIPESKKVDELLEDLQQRRVHIAIVVDEYGGTAGLVTIEDLVEEIVGEIQDEFDREEPAIQPQGEGVYLLNARLPLDEVQEVLGVALPADGGDTLGGFIYSQLGRVPVVGDEVTFGRLHLEVLSVMGRRIKQVRAESLPESEEAHGENDSQTLPARPALSGEA
ncbi:MAG: HlyC/CorC family transporter [Anaerolineae bacterium]|nr:HlyC/CorC family transporter [Anaerolineae bacterium]